MLTSSGLQHLGVGLRADLRDDLSEGDLSEADLRGDMKVSWGVAGRLDGRTEPVAMLA